MVLLVQKGLPTNKKSKDPVLVCSMRLRVLAGLQESWRSRIQAREVMGLLVRARTAGKEQTFFLPCPLSRLPAWPRLKVDLPSSKIQIKGGSFHFK